MVQWVCTSCGKTLLVEGFTGPRAWFTTEGVASALATRYGWSPDLCPDCQPPHR